MKKIEDEYLKKTLFIMKAANVALPKTAEIKIYHHNGIKDFNKTGAVFINIVNREYSKSYVIMFEGQSYPMHYHKIKQESFYVLYGDLSVCVNHKKTELHPGDLIHIERGEDHSFSCNSVKGVVFEELSTTYTRNDSFYEEEEFQNRTYHERQTLISEENWKEIRTLWRE